MSDGLFFHADQVGSLLRPAEVLAARDKHAAGEIDLTALRKIEDAAIADAVKKQEAAGLPIICDGEFRRENFWIDFIRGIEGLEIAGENVASSFSKSKAGEFRYAPKNVRAVGKIRHSHVINEPDYKFLEKHTDRAIKITLPSPTRAHVLSGKEIAADPAVYPSMDEYWADLTGAVRDEIAGLEALGCRYIQIDEPYFSSFIDPKQRENLKAIHGDDTDALLELYVDVLNACTRDRKSETTVALHICRGNARSTWVASGGYGALEDTVLARTDVDTLLLEYDDERSGDFEPLRKVPDHVRVVLGLLTTKRGDMEDPAVLKARIAEAAKIIPMDRLALSPQCGFASVAQGNILSEEDQWKKLALTVKVAGEVWGSA
jgi:5-methyltetrahydropteroyltriglutamate--homocysteine methyltransferase